MYMHMYIVSFIVVMPFIINYVAVGVTATSKTLIKAIDIDMLVLVGA